VTNVPTLTLTSNPGSSIALVATGSWTSSFAPELEKFVADAEASIRQARHVNVDVAGIRDLDTLGTWLIERILRHAAEQGGEGSLAGVPDRYAGIVDEMHLVNRRRPAARKALNPVLAWLNQVGRAAVNARAEMAIVIEMLGAIALSLLRVVTHPRSFRFTSAVHHLYRIGWQAVPIILLITFLIGAIIAQQGIFHFRKFGAESYVVDMVGILVLRELGVLIVAIMVAGRSGSAYTAELGSMKMREEIDALRTMNFDPVDILILPRILALIIGLPILAFIGSLAALYGGGLVAWLYGGMSPATFIERLHEAVSVTHFQVGIIKAPFMALTIGAVACAEGLRVKGSAESLGLRTTTSVVKSIFLVIVLDGIFAIFFASIEM
jgi:phospholipid/cholesterol/gamma-HCH transport system permease protein